MHIHSYGYDLCAGGVRGGDAGGRLCSSPGRDCWWDDEPSDGLLFLRIEREIENDCISADGFRLRLCFSYVIGTARPHAHALLFSHRRNHASNAFMLHALGITHVVSVGECALVPPEHAHGAAGAPTAKPGSLWIEEREGRIKVLDIKGVCDDGIDTLEPQLEPICEWIDKARAEGGKVLVHCRVGVSRSATVTVRSSFLFNCEAVR